MSNIEKRYRIIHYGGLVLIFLGLFTLGANPSIALFFFIVGGVSYFYGHKQSYDVGVVADEKRFLEHIKESQRTPAEQARLDQLEAEWRERNGL